MAHGDKNGRGAARRRWLIAGTVGALGPVSTVVDATDAVGGLANEVWIDLSEPLMAGAANDAEADRRRRAVALQQDRIGERLRELGIVEVARVRHVRNAILVRATPAQLDRVRGLAGVVRVQPAQTLHPPKLMR